MHHTDHSNDDISNSHVDYQNISKVLQLLSFKHDRTYEYISCNVSDEYNGKKNAQDYFRSVRQRHNLMEVVILQVTSAKYDSLRVLPLPVSSTYFSYPLKFSKLRMYGAFLT